jgi:hypothetical protein
MNDELTQTANLLNTILIMKYDYTLNELSISWSHKPIDMATGV